MTATIHASGSSGDGRITGISLRVAMDFAVMLARAARSRGVLWPRPYYNDPYEGGIINGLQVQLDEADAVPPAQNADVDLSVVEDRLDQTRRHLRRALESLDDTARALSD